MSDYKPQILIFGLEGLDLKRSLDNISDTRLARMTNIIRYEDGSLTSRPGLTSYLSIQGFRIDEFARAADGVITARDRTRWTSVGFDIPSVGTFGGVHSLIRVDNPRTNGYMYVAGIGTSIYTGTTQVTSALAGFSGNPLSLVEYRPPLSSDSYLYIGDSSLMRKLAPDGTFTPIGLPPATSVNERFRIDEFARVASTSWDARKRTRWTSFGFDLSAGNTGPGNFLTYADERRITIDLFESVTDWAAWTNNAGSGGTPSNGLSSDTKEGTYSAQFLSAVGAASAGYYNFWIRSTLSPNTSEQTVPQTEDLLPLAIGTYNQFIIYLGLSVTKPEAVQAFDAIRLQGVSDGEQQSFTVNPPVNVATTEVLDSVIVVAEHSFEPFDTGTPYTYPAGATLRLGVRLGGTDQWSAATVVTAFQEMTYDVTALRPGGGTWTVADLSTVQILIEATTHAGEQYWLDYFALRVTYDGPSTVPLSLTTFNDGVTVDDADIIHFWIKIDKPKFVDEIRLYFIVSSDFSLTTLPGTSTDYNKNAYVKAFRPSDYTQFFEATANALTDSTDTTENQTTQQQLTTSDEERTGTAKIANEQRDLSRSTSEETSSGAGQWTEFGIIGLPLRRGDFKRIGNDADSTWATVYGMVLAVITNDNEVVTVNLDGMYLTGGAGLDSTIPGNQPYDYRVINYDPRTGVKSNPTVEQGPAYRLDSVRRGIIIHPNAYGDSAIRQHAYRRGGSLVSNWYKCAENTSDGGTILDEESDAEILNAEILETDNDQPVTTVDSEGDEVLAQKVAHLWGPIQDLIFACGDPYRAGSVYWCKRGAADHWPATNYLEVCAPSEKLMNGFVFRNQAFVFSRKRLFNLYIGNIGANLVNANPTACLKGLIGEWSFHVATNGIYFAADDGFYFTEGGPAQSLTDEFLFPLFNGQTKNGYYPIDKSQPNAIRVWSQDNDIWFAYIDTQGAYQVMIWHATMKYWRHYNFGAISITYGYQEDVSNPKLLLGSSAGYIYNHTGISDNGVGISSDFKTGVLNQGVPRHNKQYGDVTIKAALNGVTVTVNSYTDWGATQIGNTNLIGNALTTQYIIDPTSNSGTYGTNPRATQDIQLAVLWTTNALNPYTPTIYHGGPSFIILPESTQARPTDWEYYGRYTDKYVKGIYIDCDTGGQDKVVSIQSDGTTQTSITANASGRQALQFSWERFLGRNLRLVPQATGVARTLVAYYKLEEATGTTRVDYTGRGNDLTDVSANVAQVAGVFGYAASFNGTTAYLNRADNADFTTGDIDFTLTALVKLTDLTNRTIMAKTLSGGVGDVDYFIRLVSNRLQFGFYRSSVEYVVNADTLGIPVVDTWYRVFAWWNASSNTLNIQINGLASDSSAPAVVPPTTANPFRLGRSTNGSTATNSFNGVIEDAALYKGILTTEEKTAIITYGVFPINSTQVQWLYYGHRWIFDEEPAKLSRWETNELDHGIPGWQIPVFGYITIKSTANVTLTLTVYNQAGTGTDYVYVITSTGGLKAKGYVKFNASKGVFFKYTFTSAAAFYLYREESVIFVQPFGGGDGKFVQPFGSDDLDGVRGLRDAGLSSQRSGGGNQN